MERIEDEARLDAVFGSEMAMLFKHSAICPVSAVAMEQVRAFERDRPDVPVYVIDVLARRPLSQKAAAYFGVRHESPQVIIIRDGTAAWHASHYEITAVRIADAVSAI